MRNKDKTKIILHLPLLSRFNLILDSPTSSHPKQHRARRNGDCSQVVTLHLYQSFPFTLYSMGSIPSILPFTDFSNTGPSHRLQFFKNCSSMGPPLQEVQSFRNKLLQHGGSMDCSFLQGIFICSNVGSLKSCSVNICFTMILHGLQGDNLKVAGFCPFLDLFSQSHHHPGWGTNLYPAVGPFELTGTICVWQKEALAPFHLVLPYLTYFS